MAKIASPFENSINPPVCTLVLNFNNFCDTVETLESVLASTYDSNTLILVENSTDKQIPKKIRSLFPTLRIIENLENLGYAGGNNVGIQAAIDRGAEYIFIVNNDVTLEKDTLSKCVAAMKRHPDCAACQPVISFYRDHEKIWSSGTQFFLGYPQLFLKGKSLRRGGVFKSPFGLVGCAILLKTSALKKIGFFDASLFLMHEETDWCIRAMRNNFPLCVVADTVAFHKISTTIGLYSNDYLYYVGRNWLLVGKKNYNSLKYGYILITEMAFRFPYYLCQLLMRGQGKKITFYLRGIFDGIRGFSGKANLGESS